MSVVHPHPPQSPAFTHWHSLSGLQCELSLGIRPNAQHHSENCFITEWNNVILLTIWPFPTQNLYHVFTESSRCLIGFITGCWSLTFFFFRIHFQLCSRLLDLTALLEKKGAKVELASSHVVLWLDTVVRRCCMSFNCTSFLMVQAYFVSHAQKIRNIQPC